MSWGGGGGGGFVRAISQRDTCFSNLSNLLPLLSATLLSTGRGKGWQKILRNSETSRWFKVMAAF